MLLNRKLLITLFVFLSFASFLRQQKVFGEDAYNYNAKGKRNPFIALVTPEGRLLKLDKQESTSLQGLSVEGIIYDKTGRSFAIVNTLVVGIGDLVGDYQVLKIFEDRVVFIKGGESLEVGLAKERTK
jgi:hypothetical protein